MKYINILCWVGIVPLILLLPYESKAQERLRPYLNAGYVTNFKPCADCKKADTGGSIRIGILTRGRFGFYTGYLWFNEYHKDYLEYDNKGSVLLAGIDFRLLGKEGLQWYVKMGIGNEKFTSIYPNRNESENTFKPDFGLLLNIKHFNTYVGWQPSTAAHINIGVGFTL